MAKFEDCTVHFGGSRFNLYVLETVLQQLNDYGRVSVTGVEPGSVNLLELGAYLAENAMGMFEGKGKITDIKTGEVTVEMEPRR